MKVLSSIVLVVIAIIFLTSDADGQRKQSVSR